MQPTDGCFVVRIWKIATLTPSSGAPQAVAGLSTGWQRPVALPQVGTGW